MKFPAKIPTPIALLLLAVVIGGIVFLERVFRTSSNASGSEVPDRVTFTNVTDATFTASWVTQLPTTGAVLVSAPGKTNQIYYDQRDSTGKLGSYTTHSVVIQDAQPSMQYSVIPIANGQQYKNNGIPYTIKTPATIGANTNGLGPAYGIVQSTVSHPVDGALVYLTLDGGQELSALTKSSGLWLIPLNQVRTADFTSFLPTIDRMTATITVDNSDQLASAVTDTLNDSPVPAMVLGKSYDFRHQQAKTSGASVLALQPTTVSLPTTAVLGAATNRTFLVSLVSPAQGGALPTTLPLIQGTGIPNNYVGISLGIAQIMSGSAKVDANGLWNYTPPQPLTPGKQSVTITTLNQTGKPVAITHAFQIFKSGTQVLGDATPSATLAPTDTTTPTPLSSESATPTESTLSGQPPPTTGNELPTIMLLLFGLSLLVGGGVAAFQ